MMMKLKLGQAGVWLLSAAIVLAGMGVSSMAAMDAWEFLGGEMTGYAYLSRGEEIAYGVASAGGTLFLLALTVGALIGLWTLWGSVKKEYNLDGKGWR